jgi:hypothetical protein
MDCAFDNKWLSDPWPEIYIYGLFVGGLSGLCGSFAGGLGGLSGSLADGSGFLNWTLRSPAA